MLQCQPPEPSCGPDHSSSLPAPVGEDGPLSASPTVSEQRWLFSTSEHCLLSERTRLRVTLGFFTTSEPSFTPCLLPHSFIEHQLQILHCFNSENITVSIMTGLLAPRNAWSGVRI